MGFYSEYLNAGLNPVALQIERRTQLQRIAEARGRDILVIAADLDLADNIAAIDHSDLMPVTDMLQNLDGTALDLVLETPGGLGEVAEQIVRMIRDKYDDVAVIVPGTAKSAGTIMAMAADDILMGSTSALGPIDAQMSWQGKIFSAYGLLSGLEEIKQEVDQTGQLNQAYIPILQMISPGEITRASNAQKFSRDLVTEWLAAYKFKNWNVHSSEI